MIDVLNINDFIRATPLNRTAKYEGEPYGSNTSFFLVDADPGQGPGLHLHPYPETWVVLGGRALFVVDGEEFEATTDALSTVPPETPHKFTNIGPGVLKMFCIHPSPRMIQVDLE